MIRYEYECDTCAENHFAEVETAEDAVWFLDVWREQGLKVWEVN